MIYFFSKKISYTKKVLYSGLSILLISTISITLVGYASQGEVLPWLIVALIGGCSLMILTLINRDTQSAYSKWGALPSMILISLIPVIVTIFLYLAFIFLSFEELAERYIIINSSWIFATNIPLILIVSFLLHRYSNTDTDTDKITTQ